MFFESISNPVLEVIDVKRGLCDMAHDVGAVVISDNAFATPVFSRAASNRGSDVVVYSATKHIDGQGRCLGGVDAGDAGRLSARRWSRF